MSHLLLSLLATAFAGELASPWAGVPLDALPALGVQAPTLTAPVEGDPADRWRAPLEGGGFVRVALYPDADAAAEAFAFDRLTATSRQQDALGSLGDEAAGDGDGFVIFRDRNAVIAIRVFEPESSPPAADRAAALQGALVEQAPGGVWSEEGAIAWDMCGRVAR